MAGPDIPFSGGYDIATILQTTDLVSLVASYGVDVKQSGNSYTCRCFAHDDNNPSMSIYRDESGKQTTHCYSCGAHEDAIGVVKHLDGCSTAEAIKKLADGHLGHGQFARIYDEPKLKRPERTTMIPPADAGMPRMDYLTDSDGTPFGDPVGVWCYRTPEGAPWYYEARFEVEKTDKKTGEIIRRKEPRCYTWGRLGDNMPAKWACGHYNKPRPLYGLDQVAAKPKAQIIVCEGPRKADAAQQLLPMVACVGFAGGKNGIKHSDWSPISGRDVILWPDADDGGRQAFEDLAQQLIALGCRVWMLDTTGQPDKWDAADALAEGWATERTLAWAKEYKGEQINTINTEPESQPQEDLSIQPEPSTIDELPPLEIYSDGTVDHVFPPDPADLFGEYIVPQLPSGILPRVIEDHIFDIAAVINTDPAFGALTAVATVAGLIDDRIRIQVNEGYRESARLWTVCVGEPSTKKSPIMDAVRAPLTKIKKRYADEEKKIRQRQDILDARHKAKLKEYTEACIKSDDPGMLEPIPPERLIRRRIECDNLTREAFEEVLRDMPYGLIIHADELAGWIGSMDAYKSAGVRADRALWLRAYNGGPMQIDKVQRGSYLIDNWSATITGGIQPSRLAGMAGQLDEDGLLQRFLIVSSGRPGGQGSGRGPNITARDAWANLLRHIVEITPGGGCVTLSPEAAGIRDQAVSTIYRIINTRVVGRAFVTALGKWEGTTARMLLIFHVIECAGRGVHPESAEVSPEAAALAIDYMMRHLLPHMVSFYEDGLGRSEIQDCAKLLAGRIVADSLVEIKTTWLHQYGPGKWRNGDPAFQAAALNRLVEYGWIAPAGGVNNATRRPTRYQVNPHVHTLYARHRAAESLRIQEAREIGRKIRAGSECY